MVTGYNNAPQALMFTWIDPHLDLTAAQSRQTKADLTQVLAWHRQQQLPLYADWLVRMQQLAPQQVQADQVCRLADEIRDSLKPLAAQMETPLATLALSLLWLRPAELLGRLGADGCGVVLGRARERAGALRPGPRRR